MKLWLKAVRTSACAAVLVLTSGQVPALRAQTYTDLTNFNGSNGEEPSALVEGPDGDFYGVTVGGGTGAYVTTYTGGTFFKITPAGTLTPLYNFCSQKNCADGANPTKLLLGTDGNFYGTTESGGAHYTSTNYGGTIFKVTPAGALTTLYSFCALTSCADGDSPGGLLQATDGNFYGVAFEGGTGTYAPIIEGIIFGGTIFEVTPSGVLTTLYNFCSLPNCADGETPTTLLQGADGNFYGAAAEGGSDTADGGSVFEITPAGALTTLYAFCSQPGCADGAYPQALIRNADGNFYGTTNEGGNGGEGCPDGVEGCGTLFSLSPAGSLTTLYTFCSQLNCADGYEPGALIQAWNGSFFGMNYAGGAGPYGTVYSGGTVFEISPAGALATLYNFCSQPNCADGQFPGGTLSLTASGTFYGADSEGAEGLDGLIFSLNCPGPKPCSETGITTSADSSPYGPPVTLTATVMPFLRSGTPTGSVEFTNGANLLATVSLQSGVAVLTTSAILAGETSVKASYSGDTTFGPSTGTIPLGLSKASTSTSLSSNLNPSVYGQDVTLPASVATTAGAGVCTGSVIFRNGGTGIGEGTLSGNSASFSTTSIAVGTNALTATYYGDSNCLTSEGALSQVVNQATTTTGLTSSANPQVANSPVTFTATLTGQFGGNPTGTISFFSNGAALGSPVTVSARQAAMTTSFTGGGTYSITAVYSGNTDFLTSSSAPLNEMISVNVATTTSLTSSLDPSAVGQSVTFTATVKPGFGSIPLGDTVSFYNGTALLGNGTTSNGVATFATSTLPAGTYSITATFNGDAIYQPSTSPVLNQTVSKDVTTTALTSSLNPAIYGQSVTITAKVTSTGATPTGFVVFRNGTTAIGVGKLSGGLAAFTTSLFPARTNSITALYLGSASSASSTSATLSQVVTQAPTTVHITSSNNPSPAGQSITFTATVTSPYATPTGTVTFSRGATTLGTATLAGGSATIATTLPEGSDTITASYAGNADFTPSSASLIQVVN